MSIFKHQENGVYQFIYALKFAHPRRVIKCVIPGVVFCTEQQVWRQFLRMLPLSKYIQIRMNLDFCNVLLPLM